MHVIYCEIFYRIDKAFVDVLIEHGKKPLQKEEELITYLDFAEKFWKKQEEIIKISQTKI